MKAGKVLVSAVVYFCIATTIAQVSFGAILWWKGVFQGERGIQLAAAIQGIDLTAMLREAQEEKASQENSEQASFEDVVESRVRSSLDHDLRELALDKGLSELVNIESNLRTDIERYQNVKKGFELNLRKIVEIATDEGLLELQRSLESMKPAQAKQIILKFLEDNAKDQIVTVLKNMPRDKQKKIVSEFKDADEVQLYELMRAIGLGEPQTTLARDTLSELQQMNPNQQ